MMEANDNLRIVSSPLQTGEMEVKNPLFDDSNLHYQGNHK